MSTQTDAAPAPAGDDVELTYREAINARPRRRDGRGRRRAPSWARTSDADGGVFKTNDGLLEQYGLERVRNTPDLRERLHRRGAGHGLVGLRPVVEIMFADFLPTAGDAIVNELPKFRFMSGGQMRGAGDDPLDRRRRRAASARSTSATGESWFMHLPGLRVATASSPGTAYSLLRAAIDDSNPTLFFEHKGLYARKGPVDPRRRVARDRQGGRRCGPAAT